jgi:chorismate dehydratase
MKAPVKISTVSYLNSAPFVHGILEKLDPSLFTMELDIPAVCADKLLSGKVDLGLVPVAIIPKLKEHHILTEFCIGAIGAVRSVMLYSEVPLPEVKSILLDHHSRTSVQLTRVLAKEYWTIQPEWKNAEPGFEAAIGGTTAGVVIGDRTFALEGKFPFTYDLSEEWLKFTGLPFVFACWVSNKPLPETFIAAFNAALAYGLNHLEEVLWGPDPLPAPREDILHYLRHNISYVLDEEKKKGLSTFLEKCAAL